MSAGTGAGPGPEPDAGLGAGADIAIVPEPPDSATAAALLASYRGELAERFPGGFTPPPGWAAAASQLVPPNGAFLVVRSAGEPLGCGGVRVLESGVAELKHMWVSPLLRGRGVGRRLLAALEAEARALGCATVRLDTSPFLPEAIALYRSLGYTEIPRYNDNPLDAIWMERRLG